LYINTILEIINILFKNIETGNTFIDEIYYNFYKLCGLIQRNIYYIKGAFNLGYKEKGIIGGINKIFILFKLKYYVFKEKTQKELVYKSKKYTLKYTLNNIKKIYISKKENFFFKLDILYIKFKIEHRFKKLHIKFIKLFYNKIIGHIFKVSYKEYLSLYFKNMRLLFHYYELANEIFDNIIDSINQLT